MGSQLWVGEFAEELLSKGAQGDASNLKGTEAPGQGWDQERPATVQAGSLQLGHGKDGSSAGRPFKTHAGLETPQRLRTLAEDLGSICSTDMSAHNHLSLHFQRIQGLL